MIQTRRVLFVAGLAVYALPLAAQNVVQQGWNPKEVINKETYVKPPEIVERIVTAPRNNVSFTNPSPDRKWFIRTPRSRRAALLDSRFSIRTPARAARSKRPRARW